MQIDEKEYHVLKAKADKSFNLKMVLIDLFNYAQTVIVVLRVILYIGSVLGSWFYLHDKVLAVAIVSSLTVAHVLIELKAYLNEKEKQLLDLV